MSAAPPHCAHVSCRPPSAIPPCYGTRTFRRQRAWTLPVRRGESFASSPHFATYRQPGLAGSARVNFTHCRGLCAGLLRGTLFNRHGMGSTASPRCRCCVRTFFARCAWRHWSLPTGDTAVNAFVRHPLRRRGAAFVWTRMRSPLPPGAVFHFIPAAFELLPSGFLFAPSPASRSHSVKILAARMVSTLVSSERLLQVWLILYFTLARERGGGRYYHYRRYTATAAPHILTTPPSSPICCLPLATPSL